MGSGKHCFIVLDDKTYMLGPSCGVGRGGAIKSFAARSHTDVALPYDLMQFHRCVMLPEHIFIWIGWGGGRVGQKRHLLFVLTRMQPKLVESQPSL